MPVCQHRVEFELILSASHLSISARITLRSLVGCAFTVWEVAITAVGGTVVGVFLFQPTTWLGVSYEYVKT